MNSFASCSNTNETTNDDDGTDNEDNVDSNRVVPGACCPLPP